MADDGFGDAMTLLDRADIEAIVTGSKTTIVKAWLDATGDTPDMIEVSHEVQWTETGLVSRVLVQRRR